MNPLYHHEAEDEEPVGISAACIINAVMLSLCLWVGAYWAWKALLWVLHA